MHPESPASTRVFTLADFDFDLPPGLVAQYPAVERSASRLLDGTAVPASDRVSEMIGRQSSVMTATLEDHNIIAIVGLLDQTTN